MTPRFITYLRQIDVVTVKGSIEPVEFWTIDMNLDLLEVEKPKKVRDSRQERKMNKVRERIYRNRFKEACFSNQIQVSERFETDPDLKKIREGLTSDYQKMF
jgi:hypothetical protein